MSEKQEERLYEQIIDQLARELRLNSRGVSAAVGLLDDGNTIPFIARYRKEATGELDENQLRDIEERLDYLRNLAKRRQEVLRIIGEQGKLTPELEQKILAATILQELEDLYLPFRPKRRTRASMARDKGLAPLAERMLVDMASLGEWYSIAAEYISDELGVVSAEEALAGASDILAEQMAEVAENRRFVRELYRAQGYLECEATDESNVNAVSDYYGRQESVAQVPPYRVLAINRGERDSHLRVKVVAPEAEIIHGLELRFHAPSGSGAVQFVQNAVADGYKRLMAPSIEREIRSELAASAEEQAIKVFALNLRQLLLTAPVKGRIVMGVDPAFRTGCKIAVVDATGRLLDLAVIYPHMPVNKPREAHKTLREIIHRFHVELIAIGNGTASRETERFIAELIPTIDHEVFYTIVSEAGASVYSASKVAGDEFPALDLSQRSAISIARRLQDPLSELVKIEAKAIGVGQYQHDVDQKQLEYQLEGVVESVVNHVGVDLNTASVSLLQHVAGVKGNVAKNIVTYREENGLFHSRADLKKVPRLGDATFVQAAGFLRIAGGAEPLDNTSVHPESYRAARLLLQQLGYKPEDLGRGELADLAQRIAAYTYEDLAERLDIGLPTLKDMLEALAKPGRDPRADMPPIVFSSEVLEFSDLRVGMIVGGVVRNVVDFGCFVDIGVHQDGLVHISEIAKRRIEHPLEAVKVGETVRVKIISLDAQRKRIGLSIRQAIAGSDQPVVT